MTSSVLQAAANEELARRRFQRDPECYAREVLGAVWTDDQAKLARLLLEHKRLFVRASHSVGKTHVAGGIINWFVDAFGPCIALTTAPTEAQVTETLWKEVRVQRRGRPGLSPKAPRIELAPDWFAAGYTARDATAFQGRHAERVLIVFDESTGVDSSFWDAAEGMMTGDECYWLAIGNPTDTSSRAYEEDMSGRWHTVVLSALDHPNIKAELEGNPPPFPAAVRLGWVRERLEQWCDRIPEGDQAGTDILVEGQWWRPGPLFESRVLGRWPTQGATSVWSDSAWQSVLKEKSPSGLPEGGCDVARFGDDDTAIHIRQGPCSLHHETHNGWSTSQTAGRLKELSREFFPNEPTKMLWKIDDDGVGGGVTDQKGDYNFQPVSGASVAIERDGYPNRRSELWFSVSQRAKDGNLDISRLDERTRARLRQQAMAPTWKLDSQGRRVVEPKDQTKKRLKRSPDDMDAMNLAYAPGHAIERDDDLYKALMGG